MAVAWQTRGDTWVRLSIRLLFKRHNATPGIRRIPLMPASRRLHDLQKKFSNDLSLVRQVTMHHGFYTI
jgi:hypothetical protein